MAYASKAALAIKAENQAASEIGKERCRTSAKMGSDLARFKMISLCVITTVLSNEIVVSFKSWHRAVYRSRSERDFRSVLNGI
jgi:hypothetical protein